MKAVLQYRASPGFRERLTCAAEVVDIEVVVVDETDTDGFRREMADAEVLLHVLEPVTAGVIAAAPRLQLIQKIGVGVNTIDLEAARARGVAVANMPGTNTQAVAEMTLCLMLAALRRVTYLDPLTRRGRGWMPDLAAVDDLGEISGKTVGFVGFGAVPSRLAPALRALGARVVYTERERRDGGDAELVELDELLGTADIISLHVPATPQTQGLVNREAIGRMKPGALLINTARGDLVDQGALIEALQSGRLRAAGLDVFSHEPIDRDDALLSLENVVVTPHLAWLTQETLDRSLAVAIENCQRLRRSEPLLHQVV